MLDEAAKPRDAGRRACALARGFALLLAFTFALIVLGALVRAHGAGLACPDWPLCFGQLIPQMDFQIAFEWSHRALAGAVSLGLLGLAIAAWRLGPAPDTLRRAILLAAILLPVQALLGALTVWQLLASWTVTAHLLTGNAFAATLLWIALELRERQHAPAPSPPASAGARRALVLIAALLVLQVALGGLVSSQYAGLACPEWPTCNGGQWFPSFGGAVGLHLAHRWNGALLLAALLGGAWIARDGLGRLLRAAALLGLLQLAVGVANVWTGIPVEVTALHSALAAALVLVVTAALRATWGR